MNQKLMAVVEDRIKQYRKESADSFQREKDASTGSYYQGKIDGINEVLILLELEEEAKNESYKEYIECQFEHENGAKCHSKATKRIKYMHCCDYHAGRIN